LHDVTFHISSGERVGVVGRTGSGKVRFYRQSGRFIQTDSTPEFPYTCTSSMHHHRGQSIFRQLTNRQDQFRQPAIKYHNNTSNCLSLVFHNAFALLITGQPELLSGSLRANLDPFEQYDDATLNEALRAAGLFSIQNEDDEARITLDTSVSGGGGNFSVGQRQIFALARAIVRKSKLLIMDEGSC
jgi:ABC-type multidrug transport system fused ATPase/permease subunit